MLERAAQWRAFVRRSRLPGDTFLAACLELLRAFLTPLLMALRSRQTFDRRWTPGGPWLSA